QRQLGLTAADGDWGWDVRCVIPGKQLDEGRLARAVLTDEAVDLAGANGKRDAFQRSLTTESLLDAADRQGNGVRTLAGQFWIPQSALKPSLNTAGSP